MVDVLNTDDADVDEIFVRVFIPGGWRFEKYSYHLVRYALLIEQMGRFTCMSYRCARICTNTRSRRFKDTILS